MYGLIHYIQHQDRHFSLETFLKCVCFRLSLWIWYCSCLPLMTLVIHDKLTRTNVIKLGSPKAYLRKQFQVSATPSNAPTPAKLPTGSEVLKCSLQITGTYSQILVSEDIFDDYAKNLTSEERLVWCISFMVSLLPFIWMISCTNRLEKSFLL